MDGPRPEASVREFRCLYLSRSCVHHSAGQCTRCSSVMKSSSLPTSLDPHPFRSRQLRTKLCQNRVTYPPETTDKHGDLRRDTDARRSCGKSLMGTALAGIGVRQHARPESISKRAPSTTRTSLRFRINDLRRAWNSVAQNPPSRISNHISHVANHLTQCAGWSSERIVSGLLMLSDHLRRFSSRSVSTRAASAAGCWRRLG
jgi:hypothetical protein